MEPTYPGIHLQTLEHNELLDVVDRLRSQGIDHYIDLPQLIVCGDQSAGKSSVLEAISGGLRFPTGESLCTRFATELILRRGPTSEARISIIPREKRSVAEQKALASFVPPETSLDQFPAIIDAAATAMGIDPARKAFSKDILRVELSGPTQPHLTLVDLPGIYHTGNQHQPTEGVSFTQDLVNEYMEKKRAIILAVVSAQNIYPVQVVTGFAQRHDPLGERTLGIITKPDTLGPGSETQQEYQELVKTDDGIFKLGWHMLRNRDYSTRDCSTAERDQAEEDFFEQDDWKDLPKARVGIESLRTRLSRILLSHISQELPKLYLEVEKEIGQCKNRLQELGSSRDTVALQRKYLRDVSQKFSDLMNDSIDGDYSGPFFDSSFKDGYKRRLRAVTQSIMGEFTEKMRLRGHSVRLVDSKSDHHGSDENGYPKVTTRDDFLEYVKFRMRINRGTELPGIFNPGVIGELFRDQSKKWEGIVHRTREELMDATEDTITLVLMHVTDQRIAKAIKLYVIQPRLETIRGGFREKTDEVLRPHKKGHPTTLNHYFIENLQRKRRQESRKLMAEKLAKFFGKAPEGEGGSDQFYEGQFNIRALLDSLIMQTEVDFERFACLEATNAMEAYYKVALKAIIDAFNMYAVEGALLKELPNLLASEAVDKLDDQTVRQVASESAGSVAERAELERKHSTLQRSLEILQRLKTTNFSGSSSDERQFVPITPRASNSFINTVISEPGNHRERIRAVSTVSTPPDSAIGMGDEEDGVSRATEGFQRPNASPRRLLESTGSPRRRRVTSVQGDTHIVANGCPTTERVYPSTFLEGDTNNVGSGSPVHGSGSSGQPGHESI